MRPHSMHVGAHECARVSIYTRTPGAKVIRMRREQERHVGHHGDGATAPETTATLDVMGQREPLLALLAACPAARQVMRMTTLTMTMMMVMMMMVMVMLMATMIAIDVRLIYG